MTFGNFTMSLDVSSAYTSGVDNYGITTRKFKRNVVSQQSSERWRLKL